MDLRQLGYFVAVVEEKSMTAAAQRLQMTQPPLTAAVAGLEKETGVRLLVRHARGVTTTDAGAHLLLVARQLLADAERGRAEVRSLGLGSTGVLALGVVPSAGWSLAPRLLRHFMGCCPSVQVHLEEVPGPGAAMEALRQRRVQACILYTTDPAALCRDYAPDMVLAVLARERMLLLADRSAVADGAPVEHLADHVWFTTRTSPRFPGLNAALQDAWRSAGIEPLVRQVSSMSVAAMFVRAGLGVAPVAESFAENGLGGELAVRAVNPRLPALHGVLVRPRESAAPTLQRLLDCVGSFGAGA